MVTEPAKALGAGRVEAVQGDFLHGRDGLQADMPGIAVSGFRACHRIAVRESLGTRGPP